MIASCIRSVLVFWVAIAPSLHAQETPKDIIRHLPVIRFETQCPNGADCDRTVEDSVIGTLTRLGRQYLRIGMSRPVVKGLFGLPTSRANGEQLTWRDRLFGNQVEVWTYAVTLSGTMGYHVIFVNGCLDRFSWEQTSELYVQYGRPLWSTAGVRDYEDYRFDRREAPRCEGPHERT